MIGLWFGCGVAAAVIIAGIAGVFPSRSGWLMAFGIVVATGGGIILALQTKQAGLDAAPGAPSSASALIAGAAALIGLLVSGLWVLGGPARAIPTLAEVPARITGQVHGMWDSALLARDLEDLRTELGDRELQNLYLMETYYTVDAYALKSEVGVDAYVFRNGDLTLSDKREGWSTTAAFTMADIDLDVIRSVAEQIYDDDPGAQIALMYVTAQNGFSVHVSIDGEYTSETRVFDGRSGEELAEGER